MVERRDLQQTRATNRYRVHEALGSVRATGPQLHENCRWFGPSWSGGIAGAPGHQLRSSAGRGGLLGGRQMQRQRLRRWQRDWAHMMPWAGRRVRLTRLRLQGLGCATETCASACLRWLHLHAPWKEHRHGWQHPHLVRARPFQHVHWGLARRRGGVQCRAWPGPPCGVRSG